MATQSFSKLDLFVERDGARANGVVVGQRDPQTLRKPMLLTLTLLSITKTSLQKPLVAIKGKNHPSTPHYAPIYQPHWGLGIPWPLPLIGPPFKSDLLASEEKVCKQGIGGQRSDRG